MLRFLQNSTLKRLSFPLFIAFGLFGTLIWGLGGLTQSVDASTGYFSHSFFEGEREERASVCTIGVSGVLTYATLQDAVYDVEQDGTVTVEGVCTHADATAQMAYITKSLTLLGVGNGATLDANQAGRLLYITGTVSVMVQNLELREGDAVGNGGGIYVIGAEVTLENSVITSNTASNGGGLYVVTGTLTLNNTTVEHNKASSGGGVYLDNSTALFKGGSNLAQNEATSTDGGGIFAHHSMMTVKNSSIMTNTAQQSGGGIYADNHSSSSVTLMGGSEVVANEATLGRGGGVHATEGSVILDGIIVSNHVITDHGAALYLDVIEATLKDNVLIENKSREGRGGALYLKAEEAEFSGNLINNNQAQGDGGGFCVEVGEITLENNTFLANKSVEGRGGALHLDMDVTDDSPQANISGNIINENEAKTDGGGFSLRNIDHQNGVLLSNNEFNTNKSLTGNGGALYLYNSNATLNNNNLVDNEAQNNGGGLYAHSNSDVKLENDNEVLNNTAVAGSGGGLYLNSGAAIINDNRIKGNSARIHGGGYYANNDNNRLDGNSFSNNQAETGHGGGLYINGDAATLTENRIEQNSSPAGRGGGMYIVEVAARISDSYIIGNEAVFGGGLFLSLDSSVVSNNIITDNSGSRGGGFFLSNSAAELIENQIMTNTASDGGGLFLSESDEVEIKENLIAHNIGNSAGGGLYLELSNASIYHNQITTNTAIVADGQGIVPTEFASTAQEGGTGGAFFLTESNPTLKRNTIRANKADNGGALYFDESQPTVINNIIADNQAIIEASALYNVASSPSFKHNTIANNSGGQNGYALFITHNDSQQSTLRMTNTLLSNYNQHPALYVEENNNAILHATLWHNSTFGGNGTINDQLPVSGNPEFTNPNAGDYHIEPNSAAIDVGVNAGINEDIDLEPRPTYEDKYDIGADEYYILGVSLNYEATPNPVMAGEELIYTIDVRNTGNVIQIATITATLPSNHVEPTGIRVWTTPITPNFLWSQQFSVTVASDYGGNLTSMAEVTTNLGRSANASVTSEVNLPQEPVRTLAASFDAITNTILAGEVLTYNISVTNTGNVTLEPIITATLNVSSYPEPLTWTRSLMAGPNNGNFFKEKIPVSMTFDFELREPYTLTSILEVTGTGELKTITETVTVIPRNPDLLLAASTNVSSRLTQEGQQISYDFTVTNTGNTILYTPIVTITTVPAGAVSTDTLTRTLPLPLPPGGLWSGSTVVTVTTDAYRTLVPTVKASAQDANQFYPREVTDSRDDIETIEANVIDISQSVTSASTISDERITYTLHITNKSHSIDITGTIKDILPEQVTLLDDSQNEHEWNDSISISPGASETKIVTGTLTAGCLPEVLTNTVSVTTEQNVDHENTDSINLLGLASTMTATKSGAWDDPAIWNSSNMSNSNRVPQSSDRVYIPKNIVITVTDAIEVKTLRNEGRLVSQAGSLLEINATNILCNMGQIEVAALTQSTHLSSDIELEAPVIENRGYITAGAGIIGSNAGGSLLLSGARILNSGTLRAGDGGTDAKEVGGVGGSITLMSLNGSIHTTEESRIQSGNGGGGEAGGGDGGIISLVAQKMNVDGDIQSGNGGNILVLPSYHFYAEAGNGGTIKLFAHAQKSDENQCPQSILSATITSGNGGDAVPSYPPQTGGDSGAIYLMAAPTLALQEDSKITAGQGGKSSITRLSGNRGSIVISGADQSCPSVTLANSATEIYGKDITLFGSNKLDLSNMEGQITSEFVISATGKAHLATGGNIDLRGNTRQIIKSNLETTLAVTEIKLPSGLVLSDVVGQNHTQVEPELLNGVSLVAPDPVRGKATVPMTIPLALVNRGTQTDTFNLSAESTGLSKIKISDTLPVTVLGGEIREITAVVTPSFNFLDELYMTATLENEESQIATLATLKLRLIVDQDAFSRIYLPLIKTPPVYRIYLPQIQNIPDYRYLYLPLIHRKE